MGILEHKIKKIVLLGQSYKKKNFWSKYVRFYVNLKGSAQKISLIVEYTFTHKTTERKKKKKKRKKI